MKFSNTIISCLLFALCLQQANAQTINAEAAFASYMQHNLTDQNFPKTVGRYDGSDNLFYWTFDDSGYIHELHAHAKELPGTVWYRGFIPEVGSFIESSSHEFFLYKSRALTKIAELPSFRQNDFYATPLEKKFTYPIDENNPMYADVSAFKPWTSSDYNPCFNVSFAEWNHFLHCCLDQSVLAKDNIKGQKLQVTLSFLVAQDGVPYNIQATDVPSICPDCGEAAIKLLYKHLESNAPNQCNVKVTDKPYKQWIPKVMNGSTRGCYVYMRIPFGYDNDPQNNLFVKTAHRLKPVSSQPQESAASSDEDNSTNKDEDEPTANVVEQNGKYVLTLLKDNSKHVVFRPQPKNMDTVALRKWNTAIGINQGGWGEITKDKTGQEAITFYTFTAAGSNEVQIQPIDITWFKAMFYEPK